MKSYKLQSTKPMYDFMEEAPPTMVWGIKVDDKVIAIPFDPANTDYQAYLKWLAEGNTPQGADE